MVDKIDFPGYRTLVENGIWVRDLATVDSGLDSEILSLQKVFTPTIREIIDYIHDQVRNIAAGGEDESHTQNRLRAYNAYLEEKLDVPVSENLFNGFIARDNGEMAHIEKHARGLFENARQNYGASLTMVRLKVRKDDIENREGIARAGDGNYKVGIFNLINAYNKMGTPSQAAKILLTSEERIHKETLYDLLRAETRQDSNLEVLFSPGFVNYGDFANFLGEIVEVLQPSQGPQLIDFIDSKIHLEPDLSAASSVDAAYECLKMPDELDLKDLFDSMPPQLRKILSGFDKEGAEMKRMPGGGIAVKITRRNQGDNPYVHPFSGKELPKKPRVTKDVISSDGAPELEGMMYVDGLGYVPIKTEPEEDK